MPHKHVRRDKGDASAFELPPTEIARPLPVRVEGQSGAAPKLRKRKRGNNVDNDDTPRAFKRLMAFANGKRLKSGLDGGPGVERSNAVDTEATQVASLPAIRPGEKMSQFSTRVDAALPLSGLKRGGKDPLGLKPQRTRKEKKMHKLYDQWRKEESRIQEQREQEMELTAEKELNNEIGGGSSRFSFLDEAEPRKKGRKRSSKAADDEDPWAELKRRRAEARIGLHDTALAPPVLHKGGSGRKLLVNGASVEVGSVPKSAGSLRKREQLSELRDGVVSTYRMLRNNKSAPLN